MIPSSAFPSALIDENTIVMRLLPDDLPPAAPVRKRGIVIVDQFCGAGGTFTGAQQAMDKLGVHLIDGLSLNHWDLAVSTHATNHPHVRHLCQDVGTVRPRHAVPGGKVHLLIASPSCIFFSEARAGLPTSDQQRLDPWMILQWLTDLDVDVLLVENVRAITKWGPVDPKTGRPIKALEGKYYLAWVNAIRELGFEFDSRVIKCADHGDGTTRERWFGQFRRDGKPIVWPTPTHAPANSGKLVDTLPWRPARDVIDWTDKGKDLFDRRIPLAPNSLRRCRVGAVRSFGPLAGAYAAALDVEIERAETHHRAKGKMTPPVKMPADACGPSNEMTAIVKFRGTSTAVSTSRPVPAITAGGFHLGVMEAKIEPVLQGQHAGGAARAATSGAIALIEPSVVVMNGRSTTSPASRPTPTVTTTVNLAVAEPVLLQVNHTDTAARLHDIGHPLPAQTTSRGLGIASPVVLPFFGSGVAGAASGASISMADAAWFPVDPENLEAIEVTDPQIQALAERKLLLLIVDRDRRIAVFARLALLFRMLKNAELAAATGFPPGYVFRGDDKAVTRQIGNAVPVNTAEAITGAIIASLDLPWVEVDASGRAQLAA